MADLACNLYRRDISNDRNQVRVQVPIERGSRETAIRELDTFAPAQFISNSDIDSQLRTFVIRLMSYDMEYIPSLTEALQICEDAVATKTAEEYLARGYPDDFESDEVIATMFERIILNAGIEPEADEEEDLVNQLRRQFGLGNE